LKAFFLAVAVALGIALEANGIFMLVAPEAWYFAVPGVTTTGPFNQHFLRDIGLIFVLLGAAFVAGTAIPQWRILLWGAAAIWLSGHALFHVWEVAVGICAPADLARDFPAVSLPAIVAILLTLWAVGEARTLVAAPTKG
jgi:uncharacterized protein YjeT (DUF2065 family)